MPMPMELKLAPAQAAVSMKHRLSPRVKRVAVTLPVDEQVGTGPGEFLCGPQPEYSPVLGFM